MLNIMLNGETSDRLSWLGMSLDSIPNTMLYMHNQIHRKVTQYNSVSVTNGASRFFIIMLYRI